jgi:hypothetical protein
MKKNEMLLYQANTVPSTLAMFFLVFNTVQIIFSLNTVNVAAAGIRVMEIILLNILLSFLVFIAASEMKRYNLRWSLASLGIGIFQCLRYFFISAGTQDAHTAIAVPLMLAGITLIAASVLSLVKCGRYRTAKKEQECHT